MRKFPYCLSSLVCTAFILLSGRNPVLAQTELTPSTTTTTGSTLPTTTTTTGALPVTTTTTSTTPTGNSTTTSTIPSTPTPPAIDVINSPYRLLVGTNLDFDDNIKVSGLYAKVDIFLADQQNQRIKQNQFLRQNQFRSRFGFLGSIYLNQSLSGDYLKNDTLSRILVDRSLVRSQSTSTLAVVALASLTAKSITKVRSLGFVVHPTFRLFSSRDSILIYTTTETRKGKGEMKGKRVTETKQRVAKFWKPDEIISSSTAPEGTERRLVSPHSTIYVGAHLEVVRRVYNTLYSYSAPTAYDTLRIVKTPLQPFPNSLPAIRPTETVTVFYERYYGVSFPYRYVSNEIDLRFIPSFGVAYLAPSGYTRYMTATLDITERNSGITFGAEIRDFSSLKQPIMGLYISKSFLLTRLGDLLSTRN